MSEIDLYEIIYKMIFNYINIVCLDVSYSISNLVQGAEAKYGMIFKTSFFSLISQIFEKSAINLSFHK